MRTGRRVLAHSNPSGNSGAGIGVCVAIRPPIRERPVWHALPVKSHDHGAAQPIRPHDPACQCWQWPQAGASRSMRYHHSANGTIATARPTSAKSVVRFIRPPSFPAELRRAGPTPDPPLPESEHPTTCVSHFRNRPLALFVTRRKARPTVHTSCAPTLAAASAAMPNRHITGDLLARSSRAARSSRWTDSRRRKGSSHAESRPVSPPRNTTPAEIAPPARRPPGAHPSQRQT